MNNLLVSENQQNQIIAVVLFLKTWIIIHGITLGITNTEMKNALTEKIAQQIEINTASIYFTLIGTPYHRNILIRRFFPKEKTK